MSVYVGDRVSLGLGRETTRGTGVSAALWVPAASFDFQQRVNTQSITGAQGKIIGSEDEKVLQTFGQGTIGMDLRARAVGYFLTQLFGDVDTTDNGSGEYSHVFNLTHSNTHPTLSIYVKDPNKSERFLRSALESFTWNFSADAVSTIEVGFMSEPAADSSATADFTTTDYVFAPGTASLEAKATQAALDGTSLTTVNNFTLSFSKGSDPDFASGSTTPTDIYNTALEVTGSFERVFDSDTEHDWVFDNTNRALRFDVEDTSVDLGNGNGPKMTVDLYNVNFTNFTRDITLGDIVRETVEFKAHIEVSSGNVATATVVNNYSSYTS